MSMQGPSGKSNDEAERHVQVWMDVPAPMLHHKEGDSISALSSRDDKAAYWRHCMTRYNIEGVLDFLEYERANVLVPPAGSGRTVVSLENPWLWFTRGRDSNGVQ